MIRINQIKVPLEHTQMDIVKKAVPFIIMLFLAMVLVAYVPAISMGFLHLFK